MADPFLGEIRMFAGNFAPRGWALCNGQILSISQSTALFALLGTQYGGDGRSTFALPNLQGSVPMNAGTGAGLTQRSIGEVGGAAQVTLTTTTLPPHTHAYTGVSGNAASTDPAGTAPAVNRNINAYTAPNVNGLQTAAMSAQGLGTAGGGQPHNNMQPFLVVSFIIALQGDFPQRS